MYRIDMPRYADIAQSAWGGWNEHSGCECCFYGVSFEKITTFLIAVTVLFNITLILTIHICKTNLL